MCIQCGFLLLSLALWWVPNHDYWIAQGFNVQGLFCRLGPSQATLMQTVVPSGCAGRGGTGMTGTEAKVGPGSIIENGDAKIGRRI